jgi:hypothetical protein
VRGREACIAAAAAAGRVRVRVRVAAVQTCVGVRAVPDGLAGRAERGVIDVCVRVVVRARAGREPVKADAEIGRVVRVGVAERAGRGGLVRTC